MTMGLKMKGARMTTHVRQNTEMNSRIGRPAIHPFSGWSKAEAMCVGIGPSPSCSCGITVNLPLLVGWTSNSCFFVFPEDKTSSESMKLNMNEELRSSGTKNLN